MNDTRILWSGLTWQLGKEAIVQDVAGVKFVAGLSEFDYDDPGSIRLDEIIQEHEWPSQKRKQEIENLKWYRYQDIDALPKADLVDFDVIIDTYDARTFDQVVGLAVRARKPLICGVSELSQSQLALLNSATRAVPVFYSDIIRFEAKEFIDQAVKMAQEVG